jgi:quercetin dioxygenase-like cupin family protein
LEENIMMKPEEMINESSVKRPLTRPAPARESAGGGPTSPRGRGLNVKIAFFSGMLLGLFGAALIFGAQRLASEKVIPPQVIVDNAKVRVVRWVLKPGEGTPIHSHDLDHVSIVLHGSILHSVGTDGRVKDTPYQTGQAEFSPGGGSGHSFSNAGNELWESVAVELKK